MNPFREEALFALALGKPAAERAAWLDAECEGDPALRQRLNALLAAHEQPETLLATQAAARPTIKLDLADAPDEAVGQTLGPLDGLGTGRYKLLERVGEGGCGVVYVAEQTEPVRRRVALKVIKLGMDTKQVVARFEAERQSLAMMDHPNIAKVLEAGTIPQWRDRPYFVMELVRGIKITDYCDQPISPPRSGSICSSRSVTPSSTRIKRESSIATSSRSWSFVPNRLSAGGMSARSLPGEGAVETVGIVAGGLVAHGDAAGGVGGGGEREVNGVASK
jgi:hypothetical protein